MRQIYSLLVILTLILLPLSFLIYSSPQKLKSSKQALLLVSCKNESDEFFQFTKSKAVSCQISQDEFIAQCLFYNPQSDDPCSSTRGIRRGSAYDRFLSLCKSSDKYKYWLKKSELDWKERISCYNSQGHLSNFSGQVRKIPVLLTPDEIHRLRNLLKP